MKSKKKSKKKKETKLISTPKNNIRINFKESLFKLCKKDKDDENKSLSELVDMKLKELKEKKSQTPEESYYELILIFSSYFIKENDFIQEDYFSLIDESIYKIFNDFLNKPTEEQYKKFFDSFEELDNGAGNIFRICKKMFEPLKIKNLILEQALDLFFRIIIKQYFHLVQKSFKFPITIDQKSLIIVLGDYFRIKYNYKDVSSQEVLKLFKVKESKDKLVNSDNGNKISDNINSINSLGNAMTKEISPPTIENVGLKFLEYLKGMSESYQKKGIETPPVLDFLLKSKTNLKISFFPYVKNENYLIDHLYDHLNNIIMRINLDRVNLQENKIGYICFYDKVKKGFTEGIYSNIELNFLYEKIISDDNFQTDDLNNPNEIIALNAFKSRALSFEYYINSEIILKNLDIKERPRVIYVFKNIEEIQKLDQENGEKKN